MPNHGRSVLANIDRLNAFMDRNGLAAVAVRTGVNFTYLSGMAMPGTLARHLDIASTVRGFMVLWPRHGAPVIVLDAFAEKLARRESWIAQVEVYQAYEKSLYSRVAELIADAGLAAARIGFEQDGLSAAHWEEIQCALPRLEMFNCSRMMDEVRWIKTTGEIAQQKSAADLLDDVLAEIFPTIRDGETERDVHARMVAACMRRGAAYVHGILNSSSNDVMYGGESDVAFRTGDFVRNDYVAYFDGCPGHQSRLAILGPPSAEQMRGYELTLEIHRKTIDRCQAGVTAGEIYAFAVAEFRKKGIDYTASLVGHGMGPWFHQQEPVLRRGSAIVLEKGMILAVEPQRLHWHLQDLVLIGDGAPQLLSDKFAIDQPFVI
ncbi:MAG TPA: Xaa-Pro peptidase family protein [Bradyrhizobium sp.]